MIPKIIHQTWKTKDIPKQTIPWVESWKTVYPDFEYRFWTDDDAEELCKDSFPALWEIYKSYLYNIQRADAIRYMILYTYGGVYADMDCECISRFPKGMFNAEYCLFKWESIVTNYIMITKPKSLFFKYVLNEVLLNKYKDVVSGNKISYVIRSTGPKFLFDCYSEFDTKLGLVDANGYVLHYGITTWSDFSKKRFYK